MDLSIFLTAEAWISLVTLFFLEIVLGVDNLVFISITTDRLPEDKRHIGRKLGLAGALLMRCLFLCFASYLVHVTFTLFSIDLGFYAHGFSVRDLVLGIGGVYLIYKGIIELREVLSLADLNEQEGDDEAKKAKQIGLPQAIGTIMVMDIVFSIDSVITAVGLAEHLIVMIIAVVLAVILMMAFIDFVATFINSHPEMKILALVFIAVIGVLLVLDAVGIRTGVEMIGMPVEKLMVYFAMVFAFVLELVQMRYNAKAAAWRDERFIQIPRSEYDALRSASQQAAADYVDE